MEPWIDVEDDQTVQKNLLGAILDGSDKVYDDNATVVNGLNLFASDVFGIYNRKRKIRYYSINNK